MRPIPRHLVVAASSWASRILVSGLSFLSIRFLIGGLGADRYAAYLLLASLVGWYALFDPGVGAALQNSISERRARGERHGDLVAAAGIIAVVILAVSAVVLIGVAPKVSSWYLGSFSFSSERASLYFVVAGGVALSTTLGGYAYRVWFAEQRGYFANGLTGLGSIIACAGLFLVQRAGLADPLPWSILAALGPAAILATSSLAILAWRSRRDVGAGLAAIPSLLRRALPFWLFMWLAAAVLQVDVLVMSQLLAPEGIVIYGVTSRLFDAMALFYSALLSAFWPSATEMITRGEWKSVTRQLHRYIVAGAAVTVVFTIALVLAMPTVVGLLAPGAPLVVPPSFVATMGLLALARVWTNSWAVILQSAGRLRALYVATTAQALVNLGFQVTLIPRLGVWAVPLSLIASYVLTVAWVLPRAVHQLASAAVKAG